MTRIKPLTDEQRNALPALRTWLTNMTFPLGTSKSLGERAERPEQRTLPADVTVRVEISPPSPYPHPLLDTNALKTPEPVPLFFYALRGDYEDQPDSDAANQGTRVILFIHGGGNITGHPTHPPFINIFAQLLRSVALHAHVDGVSATESKCVVVAPSYRLATVSENAFPAALQDLAAAYDYVLSKGYDNIVIAGDSAGGNHAMVLTHLILHSGRPSPRGLVLIAPAAIQALTEDIRVRVGSDIFDAAMLERMGQAYIAGSGVTLDDPLVSGALLTFTASWPRTLVLIGTMDMQINTSRELARRITAGGAPVELVEYEERPHAWWVFPHVFPEELQDATGRIARFVLESRSIRKVVQGKYALRAEF